MESLNNAQQKAAKAGDGPVLIIAGPGTGKTKTLTARIVHLIESGQARPEEVLALTFTKKAAEEMTGRLRTSMTAVPEGSTKSARAGHDLWLGTTNRASEVPWLDISLAPGAPIISTFHALCARLLGGEHDFISEPERLALIKKLPKPAALKGLSTRELALVISRAKNQADDSPDTARLVAAYDAALREQHKLDFDDLLLQARDLLRAQPEKRPAFTHILVDEFQDTNRLQYDILQLLRRTDNLFVIGDPNQSIYGFRGASGDIFRQFTRDFPQLTAVTLDVNYRSSPEVVQLSNHVFASGPKLTAQTAQAGTVQATEVLNEYSEANWVLSEIQRAIGGADLLQAHSGDVRHSLRDFAILYRSRRAALAVQKSLEDSGLPFQVVGEGSPYERPDVQKLIALLRNCAGETATVEGFTPLQTSALLERIDLLLPPSELALQLAPLFGIALSPALKHFIGTLVRFKTLPEVTRYVAAITEQQFYDPQAEAITLLTIHAAKGLEFPHVFLLAAEEGQLPHANADEAEERRLFYVAVTRAKSQLDILHATRRGGQPAQPSRFITQLPDSILPKQRDPALTTDQRRLQKRQAKRAQTSLF